MIEDITSLYDSFVELVALTSGVDQARVIPANRGRHSPAGLDVYATYNPIPVRAYGFPEKRLADTSGPIQGTSLTNWTDLQVTLITRMEFLLSVNFMNEGAKAAAIRVPSANFRYPVTKKLYDMGIAWRSVSDIRDLTEIQQGGLQPRYQLDVNMIIPMAITDDVLRANSFTYTIEADGATLEGEA